MIISNNIIIIIILTIVIRVKAICFANTALNLELAGFLVKTTKTSVFATLPQSHPCTEQKQKY